jgi:hypothetical protein
MFGALEAARDAAATEALKNVCTQFLASLSTSYGTPSPSLTLLGPRPHSTHEGRLANELFGDYDIKFQKIRLWTRTPMKKQWTSSKTILSTLCHEFMHSEPESPAKRTVSETGHGAGTIVLRIL